MKIYSESFKSKEHECCSFISNYSKSTIDKSTCGCDAYFSLDDSPLKKIKRGKFEKAFSSRLAKIVRLEEENKEDIVYVPEFIDEMIKKELTYFVKTKESYYSNKCNILSLYMNHVLENNDQWNTWIYRLQQI